VLTAYVAGLETREAAAAFIESQRLDGCLRVWDMQSVRNVIANLLYPVSNPGYTAENNAQVPLGVLRQHTASTRLRDVRHSTFKVPWGCLSSKPLPFAPGRSCPPNDDAQVNRKPRSRWNPTQKCASSG
jgi:hypothetical protein